MAPPSNSASEDRAALPPRFHVSSFGCRASQSEGASIEAELAAGGRSSSESPYDADVVVINSCTVTAEADREVDRLIRRVNRRNPAARIIVTGCYAQRTPQTLASAPGVRYVVGNSHKSRVAQLTGECLEDPAGPGRSEVFCSDAFELRTLAHQGSSGRTRATVKVQDGCDACCAFCIIPSVRGRSRSLAPPGVVDAVRALVDQGYREVVFSGIHLGSWGRDLGAGLRLVDLVSRTLAEVPGLERLRLSSIEPLEVTPELVDVLADVLASGGRLARHLHVPMQSGSTPILRRMRRPYSAEEYGARVRRIREAMPEAAIGADVMAGFPGETDRDFMDTCRLIESLPLTYLHVFPYSPRPGTAAADLGDPVPGHVVRFRAEALRKLGAEKNREFRSRFPGRTLPVLVLGPDAEGGGRGLSDNFIEVRVDPDLEINRWHEIRIRGLTGAGLDARSAGSAFENDDGGRDRAIVSEGDVEPGRAQR